MLAPRAVTQVELSFRQPWIWFFKHHARPLPIFYFNNAGQLQFSFVFRILTILKDCLLNFLRFFVLFKERPGVIQLYKFLFFKWQSPFPINNFSKMLTWYLNKNSNEYFLRFKLIYGFDINIISLGDLRISNYSKY